MNRLINIDDLLYQLGLEDTEENREDNVGEIITLEELDKVPTAYDVDKVIEQIKKSPSDRDGLRIFDGDEPMIHKSIAMEIVKRGGIE